MSKFWLIFLLIAIGTSFARAADPAPTPQDTSAVLKKPAAKNKQKRTTDVFDCHGKALAQKDCLLLIGKQKLQIWHDKIIYTDPVTSVTETIPGQNGDPDHEVEWQSLNATQLASRWFLILTYWTVPEKDTGIETMYWDVFEIAGGHVPFKLQKAIQKRVKDARGHWRLDGLIAHQLSVKNGQVYALFGRDKILIK